MAIPALRLLVAHADTRWAAAASGVGCAAVGAHDVVVVVAGATAVAVVLDVAGAPLPRELPQPAAKARTAENARTHRIAEKVAAQRSPSVSTPSVMAPPVLATSQGLYDALVVLHVVCAVVGFGAVAVSGVYGALARDPGNRSEVGRYFMSPGLAEWLVVPVPFFGLGALLADDRSGDLTDVWIIGGSIVWIAATAILFAAVRPAEARLRRWEHPARDGRILMWAGIGSDLLFVVALALMVTQPG